MSKKYHLRKLRKLKHRLSIRQLRKRKEKLEKSKFKEEVNTEVDK